MTAFFGWESYEDCKKDWEIKDDEVFPPEDKILFASYGCSGYEGDALVIFERDGKLFENVGGHCSCYGLEDQWGPEETSWGALALRKLDRNDHGTDACARLAELVQQHEAKL